MNIKPQILEVIENEVNPKLLEHDGWIELTDVVDDKVYVRFRGACHACDSIYDTLEAEVKPPITKAVPGVVDVIIVDEVSSKLMDLARSLMTKQEVIS
ncbi:MAG: NifU family protein [Lachnospiraceae bacterium]